MTGEVTSVPHPPPSSWNDLPRWHWRRLLFWTLRRRFHESRAVLLQRSLVPPFQRAGASILNEPGSFFEHSSVSSNQLQQLLSALGASENLSGPVIEIGSFRGVTTRALAAGTRRTIIALDPYAGYGGHDRDLALFQENTAGQPNIRHLRQRSDEAFIGWPGTPVSMVFIDAIHEYMHAWYDFAAWGSLVQPGGFVAFHDVDAFPGVNLVCHRILRGSSHWVPWAYAPNIAIFRRENPMTPTK